MKIRIVLLCFVFASCVDRNIYEQTEANYGKKVSELASEFNLSSEYLKALIILECSGQRNITPRFEPHVFKSLLHVREGKRKSYEKITREDIKDASNDALRNLASSWGPFQIMGYKCLKLKINVKDLRGNNSLYWGVVWINKNYGEYVRKEKFKEAFRIHNTGSPTGRTYHANYVSNGLKHIDYFKQANLR